ncbi:hypothetical protein JW960_22820 [candidate division KSB1 bacterium]|nr:hypothetical protein [candidate division KSB1 bacterium]
MYFKRLLLILFVFFTAIDANAHNGFFVRFSIGPGFYTERSSLNESGFATPAKNHALGWGFHEKYAFQISDFGGLIKNQVGEFNYINLDALGLGFTYRMPLNTSVTLSGAQGNVTFARDWWEITDDGKETGYAINLSLDKEWLLAKRWGAGIGSHGFLFKTTDVDYEFIQFGINGTITFYFTPVR